MAAGEDQPQHVVAETILVRCGRGQDVGRELRLDLEIALFGAEPDLTPDPVDRLVAADIDQPRARIFRRLGPLLDRRRKGLLQRLFGEFEVADETDQRRQNAARLVTEYALDFAVAHPMLMPRRLRPERQRVHENTMIGRTSIEPNFADGTRAAIAVASSRFFASIR